MLPTLAAMHTRLRVAGSPWAERLEGPYVPREALRRHHPARAFYPALRVDGTFDVDGHGSDWVIQLEVLRRCGVALAGPPPANLIHPAGPDDLRRAARATLREWWAPQLGDPALLQTREYQAYAVLTMCRVLYTLHFGAVVPKPSAAAWARQRLGERWRGVIDRALAWPDGDGADGLTETLDLIQLTLESSEELGISTDPG